VVRTILLARTLSEGTEYAQSAGLARRDYVVISPLMAARLDGIRLRDGDLIAEFEGFRTHPRAAEIVRMLERTAVVCRSQPRWEKIGT
jgi:hypothetical protein